eukprot:4457776-Prymnesium_polylepis.1
MVRRKAVSSATRLCGRSYRSTRGSRKPFHALNMQQHRSHEQRQSTRASGNISEMRFPRARLYIPTVAP